MPRPKSELAVQEGQQMAQLKEEVARQLVSQLSDKLITQKQLCEMTRYSNSAVSMYKNHPSTMSGDFIRALAEALPDSFSWAWKRWNAIITPEGLHADSCDRDQVRVAVDEVIDATRLLLQQLEELRRKMP